MISISYQDILYVQYIPTSKGVHLHSINSMGYLPGTFDFWLTALASGLDNLMRVDRSYAVNLSKVQLLDKKRKVAYFDSVDREKSCTISVANFEDMVRALNKINQAFAYV